MKFLLIRFSSLGDVVLTTAVAKNIKEKPTAIMADTIKGKGISFYENQVKSHAVTMTVEQVESALKELRCPQEEIEITLTQMKEEN